MSRWIGIDHGTRRIGVAVGDAGVVTPLDVLQADDADIFGQIEKLAAEYDAVGIVVGWPLLADDSEGPQARIARGFAANLAGAVDLDVRMWDERLSSFEADMRLKGEFTHKQKKNRQDAIAAATILEDFFTGAGPASAPRPTDLDDSKEISK